ncbi:MAG: radical SAM protein [Prevotellaceae bacterium]|jgi:uncharacterized protein|nr:radical SAM protein [Prevotellaceae bacterium]
MKLNFYNHFVKQANGVICFNALSDAYLMLKENVFTDFEANFNNLAQFQENYPNQYKILCENGFILAEDFDEKEYYLNLYYERKFARNFYQLIINPTLNCNLACWYCYESHQKKSELSDEMIKNILLHIEKKYETDKFNHFVLGFFGGEPLLKPKIVIDLINKVNNLAKEKDFKLSLAFTTNGTILPLELLSLLKNFNTSFQITLDGVRKIHDTTRFFKENNKQGSYELILNNIRKITENLTDYGITLRVNYTSKTIAGLKQVVDDFDFCDRKKVQFSLHKVWQADQAEIDKKLLFEFMNYAKEHNFIVNYLNIYRQFFCCYADNYNEAVINYNGDVFKCTARDFATVAPEGKLMSDGTIKWNTEKWLNRINLRLPRLCKDCNLLPACGSICSQHRLEKGENISCMLDEEFTKDDYIIHNLNRQLIINKINAMYSEIPK